MLFGERGFNPYPLKCKQLKEVYLEISSVLLAGVSTNAFIAILLRRKAGVSFIRAIIHKVANADI